MIPGRWLADCLSPRRPLEPRSVNYVYSSNDEAHTKPTRYFHNFYQEDYEQALRDYKVRSRAVEMCAAKHQPSPYPYPRPLMIGDH